MRLSEVPHISEAEVEAQENFIRMRLEHRQTIYVVERTRQFVALAMCARGEVVARAGEGVDAGLLLVSRGCGQPSSGGGLVA